MYIVYVHNKSTDSDLSVKTISFATPLALESTGSYTKILILLTLIYDEPAFVQQIVLFRDVGTKRIKYANLHCA